MLHPARASQDFQPASPAPFGSPGERDRFLGEVQRQSHILFTKAGILILLIGAVTGWVPVIGLVGGLLTLAGAILLFLGRRAFGPVHGRNVVASILLVLVGILVAFVLTVSLSFALRSVTSNETVILFLVSLVITVVAAGVVGLSRVFFTYALQGTKGRALLWAAYVSNLMIAIGIAIVVGSRVGAASLASLQAQVEFLGRLSAIPSAMFAVAYGLAYLRIPSGERTPGTS